jgi:hypothetical protein
VHIQELVTIEVQTQQERLISPPSVSHTACHVGAEFFTYSAALDTNLRPGFDSSRNEIYYTSMASIVRRYQHLIESIKVPWRKAKDAENKALYG